MKVVADLLSVASSASQIHSARTAAMQAQQNAFNENETLRLSNLSALAAGLANFQQLPNVTPIRPERTPEEIQAQLEARMAELEREAQKPERVYPCVSCRWVRKASFGNGRYDRCEQPLVMGLKSEGPYAWDCMDGTHFNCALCGPEKALWEPIPTFWQRFTEWLSRMIERAEGRAINKGDR